MELLHECKGELRPLTKNPQRLPRKLKLAEYGKHHGPMSPLPVPYYERYDCRDCTVRIMVPK